MANYPVKKSHKEEPLMSHLGNPLLLFLTIFPLDSSPQKEVSESIVALYMIIQSI